MIIDLVLVKQGDNKRFATLEIRVRNFLNLVLDTVMAQEEIVSYLLAKRMKSVCADYETRCEEIN